MTGLGTIINSVSIIAGSLVGLFTGRLFKPAQQEALSKAWARRGSAQEQWFRPWLTRIVINECHNHWRRGKRLVVSEKVEPPEHTDVPNLELRQALDALPEKWRLPLTLHYLEGFSVAEIAHMTHTAEGTVKSRLHKARAMLKAEWEADEE